MTRRLRVTDFQSGREGQMLQRFFVGTARGRRKSTVQVDHYGAFLNKISLVQRTQNRKRRIDQITSSQPAGSGYELMGIRKLVFANCANPVDETGCCYASCILQWPTTTDDTYVSIGFDTGPVEISGPREAVNGQHTCQRSFNCRFRKSLHLPGRRAHLRDTNARLLHWHQDRVLFRRLVRVGQVCHRSLPASHSTLPRHGPVNPDCPREGPTGDLKFAAWGIAPVNCPIFAQ